MDWHTKLKGDIMVDVCGVTNVAAIGDGLVSNTSYNGIMD